MYVDIDPAEAVEHVQAIRTGDGELIVALADEVAVRGDAADVTHWAMTVMRAAVEKMSPDQMMSMMRGVMMDALVGITPAPDDASEL
jgi:hypothetical protein